MQAGVAVLRGYVDTSHDAHCIHVQAGLALLYNCNTGCMLHQCAGWSIPAAWLYLGNPWGILHECPGCCGQYLMAISIQPNDAHQTYVQADLTDITHMLRNYRLSQTVLSMTLNDICR